MLIGKQRKFRSRYRVTNWGDYNDALATRASLSVWISPDALENWRGAGRFRYSDKAIDAILMLRAVFQLPLRQAAGLVRSLLRLLDIDLPTPDISTLSRRGKTAGLDVAPASGRARNLAIDSTGLRLHGSSHPSKRQDRRRKREGWRKLHIIVDTNTGEIVSDLLTSPNVHDVEIAPEVVVKVKDPIRRLHGDRAYRSFWFGAWLRQFSPNGSDRMRPIGIFPPKKHELSRKHFSIEDAMDEDVHIVRDQGWTAWRRIRGYGQREAAERAFSRLKRIFGFRIRSRTEAGLIAEANRLVRALNVMNALGRPAMEKIR